MTDFPKLPESLKQVAVAGYHDGVLKDALEDYYDASQMHAYALEYAALQSQQGATGGDGRYARHPILRQHAAQSVAKSGSGAILVSAAAVSDLFADLDAALAHPQAAGSAPGEARDAFCDAEGHVVVNDGECFNCGAAPPSAGSVASGAGDAWIELSDTPYGRGYTTSLDPLTMPVGRYYIATAAGSAPVGVDGLWTDKQCVEFLSVAFRHCNIDGTFKLDDIRMGQRRANALAATPAIDAALEKERAE